MRVRCNSPVGSSPMSSARKDEHSARLFYYPRHGREPTDCRVRVLRSCPADCADKGPKAQRRGRTHARAARDARRHPLPCGAGRAAAAYGHVLRQKRRAFSSSFLLSKTWARTHGLQSESPAVLSRRLRRQRPESAEAQKDPCEGRPRCQAAIHFSIPCGAGGTAAAMSSARKTPITVSISVN